MFYLGFGDLVELRAAHLTPWSFVDGLFWSVIYVIMQQEHLAAIGQPNSNPVTAPPRTVNIPAGRPQDQFSVRDIIMAREEGTAQIR